MSISSIATPGGLPQFVRLDPKHRCLICHNVVRNSMQTSCGHRICEDCVPKLFEGKKEPVKCPAGEVDCEELHRKDITPDPGGRREVRNLPVFCIYKQLGCEKQVKWVELDRHVESCEYRPVPCTHENLGCTEKLPHNSLERHTTQDCEFRPFPCKYCAINVPLKYTQEHLQKQCEEVPLDCPYKCGAKRLKRQQLNAHMETCGRRPKECSFNGIGCSYQGTEVEVAAHMHDQTEHHLQKLTLFTQEIDLKHLEFQRKVTDMNDEQERMKTDVRDLKQKVERMTNSNKEGRRSSQNGRIINMDTFGTIAGFAVLGVGLCLCAIAIIWLCLKLRQHERDIIELLGKVPDRGQSNNKRYEGSYDDSAIDVNEVDARVRPLSRTSRVSFQDQANKRLSLTIHRERVNVYGKQPQMGLLLMTAQSYYKAQTKTSVDVPVEAIEVTNKATNRKTVMSQLLTDDWREGIPTSLLINGSSASFEDIFSHNKGIFIHRTVGKNGMTLEISGIKLEIPEGALEEDTLVTLGMVWDEKIVPKLTKKQTILSPLVLCQPSGLQFKKPVKLTFPHAARKVKTDWLPKILKRDGNLNESSEWEPVTLSDYEERQIGGHSICLQLYHFTLYTMVGESQPGKIAAKLVHFVAFTNQLQKGMYFKPRIYCLNSYKDEIGEVKELDQHLDHTSKVSDTSELIVHDNERDILLEVIKLCETWTLAGDRTEMLPFENVWHGFHPHCTFVMKPKKSTVVEIICELHAHQAGDDNRYAKLKLAESLPSPSSPLTPTEEDPLEDLTRELIILLDPANSLHSDAGDWRALAEKMDCSMSRLRWLGAQSSPTRLLMEKWTEGKKPLLELMQILLDINRPDAAEEVKKRLPILDSHSSDT